MHFINRSAKDLVVVAMASLRSFAGGHKFYADTMDDWTILQLMGEFEEPEE